MKCDCSDFSRKIAPANTPTRRKTARFIFFFTNLRHGFQFRLSIHMLFPENARNMVGLPPFTVNELWCIVFK